MRKVASFSAITIIGIIVVGLTGLTGWNFYRSRVIEKEIAELRWDRVFDSLDKADNISPTVGTIQFIKNGTFSISLDKVDYGANGLHLEGHIGNASNVTLNSLTLVFTATKQIYEMRGDFDKLDTSAQDTFAYFGSPSIGNAQSTAIASLSPATTAPFEVTIPNVKQTTTPTRITISFSGERYSYGL